MTTDEETLVVTGTIEYPEPPLNQWREVCRWDVGPTPVSRHEALGIARDVLKKAERERYELAMAVAISLGDEAEEYEQAFSNMAAAFEELAGEHRELLAALQSPRGVVCSMPLASEGQVPVRPYVRAKPRRSKLVETEPPPTGDTVTPEIVSQAQLDGQPEARKCGTCWGFGMWGTGDSCPMGPMDASDGCPTEPCPECGANPNPMHPEPPTVPLSPESAELVRQGLEDAAAGRVRGVQTPPDSSECTQFHTGLAVCQWETSRWKGAI